MVLTVLYGSAVKKKRRHYIKFNINTVLRDIKKTIATNNSSSHGNFQELSGPFLKQMAPHNHCNAKGSNTTKKENTIKMFLMIIMLFRAQLDPNKLNALRYNKTSLCRITSKLLTSDG